MKSVLHAGQDVGFVRVMTRNIGPLPGWYNDPAGKARLLVDEIVIE
jgi:hypothetical protein